MHTGEKLKFRVTSEMFTETSPVQCPDNPELPETLNAEPKIPYSIIVSINFVGETQWWLVVAVVG